MTDSIFWSTQCKYTAKNFVLSYSLHTFALTTCDHAWQTVFLASILPTITAQFASTSNDYQQLFLSRCEICHPHLQMVFNTALPPSFLNSAGRLFLPTAALENTPRAVVARSCIGRGRICTCTLVKRIATFSQKTPVS